MQTISRRSALLGGAAALTAAATTAPVAFKVAETKAALTGPAGDDTNLLAACRTFWRMMRAHDRLWAEQKRLRQIFEAREDTPERDDPGYLEALQADRCHAYWEATCQQMRQCGGLARHIFRQPAETPQGVLAKFRIVHQQLGNYRGGGDEDLDAYQDDAEPWIRSLGRDLERLAGRSA